MLMALSNKFGAIVLSTGNKSELGVGYCTLYGDMVGGLAVISDVPKTLVYRLSHYVNARHAVIPLATLRKPPSAELRPDQKDSDSLPPYEILDGVLEDYVEDARSAERIALQKKLASLGDKVADFDGHFDFDLRDDIRKLQQSFGMTPDGHPSRAFLDRLGVRAP